MNILLDVAEYDWPSNISDLEYIVRLIFKWPVVSRTCMLRIMIFHIYGWMLQYEPLSGHLAGIHTWQSRTLIERKCRHFPLPAAFRMWHELMRTQSWFIMFVDLFIQDHYRILPIWITGHRFQVTMLNTRDLTISLRWACWDGLEEKTKDHIKNEDICREAKMESMTTDLRQKQQRWYGHPRGCWICRCWETEEGDANKIDAQHRGG